MNIYLIRHGEAESDENGDKVLSVAGKKKIENLTVYLDKLNIRLDYVVSSPLTRAKQTAEYFKKYLNNTNNLITDSCLSPGCVTEDLINLAESLDSENIAFVGHQPDISRHLSKMISSSNVNSSFLPGSIAKVFFDYKIREGEGLLDFLIPAK